MAMPKTKPDSLQGTLDLLVLKVLSRRGPLHGYGITTQLEAISENILRVEEGSLYPALHRMEEAGWVRADWVVTENKRRARVYELTAAGRRQLEAEEARWRQLSGAVGAVLRFA
jgi:PadR family transcriptional regulator, regulatory protein PadR